MNKATKLRQLLLSKETAVLMEAHNGLSAKLVQEAGFPAIWGSGLSISAALGVRDNNEASWTQVLEVLEFMNDAVDLPILLDGDTGFGNFNNVRRLVRKLEQRGVAGVCLEDKLFPKTNSFIDGERQQLAEVDEFAGKIRAAKDSQRDSDFVVVARTEAFIAGWGLQEALVRATAYAENGADVVLVHSKRKDSRDIMSFMEHWDRPTPVVIVPTKYPSEPIQSFVDVGINNFIFANQSVRTVITALKENLRTLHDSLDLMSLEDKIAPVSEIFRLQDAQELKASEKVYLPAKAEPARALVLGASQGRLGKLVERKPKCMVRVRGKTILAWQIETFNRHDVKRVGVVRGYCKEAVDLNGPSYFDNDEHASTGELYSLAKARDFLSGDVVIAYGDIVFDDFILHGLLAEPGDVAIAVDAAFKLRGRVERHPDLVVTDGMASPTEVGSGSELKAIGTAVSADEATGEWIGLMVLRGEATQKVANLLDTWGKSDPDHLRKAGVVDLLTQLMKDGTPVHAVHTFGHWRDVDEPGDLTKADQAS